MWQELLQLRENYITRKETQTDIHRKYVRNLFLQETLKLSGTSLPEEIFQQIITSDKRPHFPEGMKAYDLWQAWKYTVSEAEKRTAFTAALVRRIAAQIMRHTGKETTTSIGRYDSSLGDFRLGEDYNAPYAIADYKEIPSLLDALCRRTNIQLRKNQVVELLKAAIGYLYEFAHIQPFGAGNIETGLMSTNYLLLFHRQPLLIVFAEDLPEALNTLKSENRYPTPAEFERFIIQQQIKFFAANT